MEAQTKVDYVDTAQIAELLHVSRAHVTDRLTKRPDFPRPRVNISRVVRRWSREEVLEWASKGS